MCTTLLSRRGRCTVQASQSREVTLDIEYYKRRLLDEQDRLLELLRRAQDEAREVEPAPTRFPGEEGVVEELKDERLQEAEIYWKTLEEVRAALQRIADGTYGRCLADGEPIDEKRLEAAPWAAHCLRHQQELERAEAVGTPGL